MPPRCTGNETLAKDDMQGQQRRGLHLAVIRLHKRDTRCISEGLYSIKERPAWLRWRPGSNDGNTTTTNARLALWVSLRDKYSRPLQLIAIPARARLPGGRGAFPGRAGRRALGGHQGPDR
jgi:hypothetical protein